MRFFGSSGIRSVANSDLLELVFRVGLAVGEFYSDVVVGTDTRTSSGAIKHAVLAGLLAAGSRVADAGVVPTPTLAFATREFTAGVMVTASHNPPDYNGVKLWNPDGSAFSLAQQEQIEERFSGRPVTAPWSRFGQEVHYPAAVKRHLKRILDDFPDKLNVKLVLDCGCGAGSVISPYLLTALGCEVLSLNCQPSGFFPRSPEPTEAALSGLAACVVSTGASLGIAHDGDADRMVAVDRRGCLIPGDKMMAILARSLKAREVVTTVDASLVIDSAFKVRRTKVGDSYVSEELKRGGGDFGGEPSGAWIFPGISYCPDGVYAAAVLAAIACGSDLAALADGIASYPILRGSAASQNCVMLRLEPALLAMGPLAISRADGLRLDFGDGWLLVRPSGTEPKLRITVEARDEARASGIFKEASRIIESVMENRS